MKFQVHSTIKCWLIVKILQASPELPLIACQQTIVTSIASGAYPDIFRTEELWYTADNILEGIYQIWFIKPISDPTQGLNSNFAPVKHFIEPFWSATLETITHCSFATSIMSTLHFPVWQNDLACHWKSNQYSRKWAMSPTPTSCYHGRDPCVNNGQANQQSSHWIHV